MTTKVPVNMVDPGQLPMEKGLSYDEICKIIGSLYLDSYRRVSILEEQFKVFGRDYEDRIQTLLKDKEKIEQECKVMSQKNTALQMDLERGK